MEKKSNPKVSFLPLACCAHFGGACPLPSAVQAPRRHFFVCCQCVTKELLCGSCVHLFWRDGRGSWFTWAESGPCESAIPWVRRLTRSRGLRCLSQGWHIPTSGLFRPCCDINHRGGRRCGLLKSSLDSLAKPTEVVEPTSCSRPERSTKWNGTVSFSFPSEMEVGSRSQSSLILSCSLATDSQWTLSLRSYHCVANKNKLKKKKQSLLPIDLLLMPVRTTFVLETQ